MTTTAQTIPALEVSAPDDNMDVLSDTGFDFGDGDIDLDLDTAPSIHDDDLSFNDAATDGGIDMQELPTDPDDFMADHGDLIEEDDVYNDEDGATAASQDMDDGAVIFEADMLAAPDEDLIDYSDDEAQQPAKMESPSVHEEADAQVTYDVETTSVVADDHQEDVQTQEDIQIQEEPQSFAPIDASDDDAHSQQDTFTGTVEQPEDNPEHQSQGVVEPQHDDDNNDDKEHPHADDDGGILLPADGHSHNDDDDAAALERQEDVQHDEDGREENDNRNQEVELRPVTVNYAGNELWLFKQHDLDESGDYLLDDPSVARSGVSGLFQACRSSLGDDVSDEHEIGFRFDHLHNLELYEDNTACIAVSLERLVDLYHTLQAQDGNEDPECFYVTLQFRPRFATLLADIAQYAEQGSGYSALNAAVSAGETHFSNVFSSASTEHEQVDWDEGENDNDEASSPGSVYSTAPQEAEAGAPDEQQPKDVDNQDEEHEVHEEQEDDPNQHHLQQQRVDLEEGLHQTLNAQDEDSRIVQEAANIGTSESATSSVSTGLVEATQESEQNTAAGRQASDSYDKRTPDQVAHDKQEAEDFVDYSDDEEDDCEADSVPAHEPSPSPSTAQGDKPAETQESGIVSELDRQDDEDTVRTGFDEHDDDAALLTQTQYGDDENHYAFQDYAETYAQGDPFQDFQADGIVGDPFDANDSFHGDNNQNFAGYNFQTLDGKVNLDFDEQTLDDTSNGNYDDEAYTTVEDATGTDGLLDLDNAPEWAIDTEPPATLLGEDAVLVHDDANTDADEGGAVDGPLATKSSDAGFALTLSNEYKPFSPQGQKRSIDEVGEWVDEAPDSTDAKRARV